LLMAAWRKSFPCAANASVASIHYSNHTKNRSTLNVGDDDDDDARSFVSGRDSRKNRHRRSFSNASQDDRNGEWNEDEEGDLITNGSSLKRRGSKRAAVKKLLKGKERECGGQSRCLAPWGVFFVKKFPVCVNCFASIVDIDILWFFL